MSGGPRQWMPAATALGAVGIALHAVVQTWRGSGQWGPGNVSDALPLFLGARAVRAGLDPTDPEVLETVYHATQLNVTKALFSVLYPASSSILLAPLGNLTWPDFIMAWRLVLFTLFVVGCAAAGAGAARGWRAVLTAAVGVWVALRVFPLTTAALGLGQANLAIIGIFGLVMGALARDRSGIAGAAAVIGAGIKLVPAFALWPMVCAGRWRGLRVAAAVGLGLLLLTWTCVPMDRIIDNLASTIAFQGGVEPHWIEDHRLPDWIRYMGYLRRPALSGWTLLLTGWCAWRCRQRPAARQSVLPLAVAIVAAALAVDAAAVGVFYSSLIIPAMVAVVTHPLQRAHSRWMWVLVPLVASPAWLYGQTLSGADEQIRMMLGAMAVWVGAMIQLIHLARPWTRWAKVGLGTALLVGLAHAWIWTFHPPYMGKPPLPPGLREGGPLPPPATPPKGMPPPPHGQPVQPHSQPVAPRHR